MVLIVVKQSVRRLSGVGGVMLWDCSWDQNNILGDSSRHYSEFIHDLLLEGEDYLSLRKNKKNFGKINILRGYVIFVITLVHISFILIF